MIIDITHPGDATNFTIVQLGRLHLAFSYETLIGVRFADTDWIVRKNDWGPTTGKHINFLDPDKSGRLAATEFRALVEERLSKRLPTGEYV